MTLAALFAILIGMCLLLVRALLGPTLYDRVLAVNSFGTKTVLVLGLLGFVMGRPDFLDVAILYTLINFVATIAILKFFRYRSFQVPLVRRPDPAPRCTSSRSRACWARAAANSSNSPRARWTRSRTTPGRSSAC